MELLGIRVQRNFCSLGGGSARKEKLWREYIYRSCLDGDVVRGILVLARSSRESGGLGGRFVCDAAGCLARVMGVGELLPATVTGAGGLREYFFAWVRGECAGDGGGGVEASLFKANGCGVRNLCPAPIRANHGHPASHAHGASTACLGTTWLLS
jgi:hypothetical protein